MKDEDKTKEQLIDELKEMGEIIAGLEERVAEKRKAHFEQLLIEKKGVRYEDVRDGMWNDSFINPILDDYGQVARVVVLGLDITDLKQAEGALQESEAKYRALIDATDTGFVIIDQRGKVFDANQEYVRLTGHRHLNEILGRSVIEWTAHYHKEENSLAVRKSSEDGYVRSLEIDFIDSPTAFRQYDQLSGDLPGN
jgi:PAS domain-containing protein